MMKEITSFAPLRLVETLNPLYISAILQMMKGNDMRITIIKDVGKANNSGLRKYSNISGGVVKKPRKARIK